MGQPDALEVAKLRLETAVEAIEKAVELRKAAEAESEALRRHIETLDAERHELAAALGAERERAATLETSSAEVCERLEAAIETIKIIMSAS